MLVDREATRRAYAQCSSGAAACDCAPCCNASFRTANKPRGSPKVTFSVFESFEALLARYAATGSLISRQGRRTYRSFLTVNSPASAAALADLEAWLGCTLPGDYRAFLQRWNGASMYALEHDHHPSFAASDLVPALQDQYEQDPRVLIIGQSDDEGFFLLDRRDNRAADWPFYWADELQPMDELLDSPPLARASSFLDDFIAAEGEWYWQVRPRVPWSWAEQQPNWWVHGGGLALRLEPRVYVGQPPTTWSVFSITATPPGLLLAAGLRTLPRAGRTALAAHVA